MLANKWKGLGAQTVKSNMYFGTLWELFIQVDSGIESGLEEGKLV